jgi:transposase
MHPIDRRKIAIHIYSMVKSLRKTAVLLQVSHSSIQRWLKNQEKKRYVIKNKQTLKSEIIVNVIKISIQNDPFVTLIKLRHLIKQSLDIDVSKELIRIAIKRQGITKKKARFYGEPKYLPEQTKQFIEKRNEYMKANKTFISIDEVSFGRNGINTSGYSEKGQKLFIKKRACRMSNITVVAACTSETMIGNVKINGSCDSLKFLTFLKFLDIPKERVLLMDNVKFHHSKIVTEYCNANNINILFIPAYSPWFNPIELCFSVIKRHYYKNQNVEDSLNHLL